MSKVIGIICEYNPFHKGHKYQIDQIRSCEPDATIVAIMSGNIVQRGEFSVISKYDRAKIALECGVNAVFEMPYPYSGSCAEIFASAGVTIAHSLGCDEICFGIEKLSLSELEKIAFEMETERFQEAVNCFMQDKSISYISAKEKALSSLGFAAPKYANDMLALEYIRAIKKKGLALSYKAIKRTGAFYNDTAFGDIMSASAIRKHFFETGEIVSVPECALKVYREIVKNGRFVKKELFSTSLHTHCLLTDMEKQDIFDTSPEMVALIKKASSKAVSGEDFVSRLSSKAFTTARLKRSILYSIFNVKGVDFTPEFTLLLGMDDKGQALLNSIKKKSKLTVITKHSDGKNLSDGAASMLEALYKVDSIYNALLGDKSTPCEAYKNKPIIKSLGSK